MLLSNIRFVCGISTTAGNFGKCRKKSTLEQKRIQCDMSPVSGKALTDREKILNVFSKQLKSTDKNCCSVNKVTADYKCKTDRQHKKKRLKSCKERAQMRGGGREASKSVSYHSHCHCQTRKDTAHYHHCCHSGYLYPSRRDALFPKVVPAAQEPSIITDSRLTGHQGLFNREVKSIDIERLLSEQKKLKRSGQQAQGKSSTTSQPSSTSGIPSPFTAIDLLGADTDEVIQRQNDAGFATKAHDDCQEKQKKISQESDLIPGRRPQQQRVLSSGSLESMSSSKHSSPEVVIIKSRKTKSNEDREAQLTPTVGIKNEMKTLHKKVKGHMISMEKTPEIQDSPVLQTQAHGLSPSPVQLSSSHTAHSFDIQHRRQDPDCVSVSVSAVAAGLCDCLLFPLLKKRSLVAESRGVLLEALQERHGNQFQENLLKVQQCPSFGPDPRNEVQDQVPTMEDVDEILPSVFQASTASQSSFENQKTTSFKLKRSGYFNWKSSPPIHHNLKQTAEWLTSPVETPVSFLDDVLRPTHSPQYYMDLEPSGVSANNHLFAPSPISCWEEKASASQHWEGRFNRPKSKEAVVFGSFKNSFMNCARAVTERSSGSQISDNNIHPIFSYQAQLPHTHSTEPVLFPQEQGQFDNDRYYFSSSFPVQMHYPGVQNSTFQPFSQFSHPPTCSYPMSHHTDMMHYPPSHMLERDSAPPASSLLSPQHWSFPPMRLY